MTMYQPPFLSQGDYKGESCGAYCLGISIFFVLAVFIVWTTFVLIGWIGKAEPTLLDVLKAQWEWVKSLRIY